MISSSEAPLRCDIEKSIQDGIPLTTVRCHGRLIHQTAAELKGLVKPMILAGGAIVIDLSELTYLDSMGLGTLVGLKVSAINEGYCTLKLEKLSPRVQELLRLTKLTQIFAA